MGCGPSKSKQTPSDLKEVEFFDKKKNADDPSGVPSSSKPTGISGNATVNADGSALESSLPTTGKNTNSDVKVSDSRDARNATKGSTAPPAKVQSEATASSAKPSAKASAKPEAVANSPLMSPSPTKRRHVHDAAGHTELISQVVGTGMNRGTPYTVHISSSPMHAHVQPPPFFFSSSHSSSLD